MKSPTASFLSHKEENLFSVIEGRPGPFEYSKSQSSNKFWSSSVQAFGKTERRFITADQTQDSQMLGP